MLRFDRCVKRKSKKFISPSEKKSVDKSFSNCYTNYIRKQKGLFPRKFTRALFQVFEKIRKMGLDFSVFF